MATENTEAKDKEPQSFPSGLKRAWLIAIVVLVVASLTPDLLERLQEKGWTRHSSGRGSEFALVRDTEERVWVSEWQPYGHGWWLNSIDINGTWTIYQAEGGGFRGPGQALAIDPHGRLWAANDAWLNLRQADGRWIAYDISGLVEGDKVTALAIDRQGRAWIGSQKGLGMLSPDGVWSWYTPGNSRLVGAWVDAIVVDQDDTVWVGSRGGLNGIESGGRWLQYHEKNSEIVDDSIRALAIGPEGELWIGAYRGLCVLELDGQWRTIDSSLQGNSIFFDDEGRTWFASSSSVRILEADGQMAIFDWSYSGVPPNIDSIVVDAGGRAWIGSRAGLYAFDRSQSLSVAALKRIESIISFLGTMRCLSMASLALLGVVTIRRLRRRPVESVPEAPVAAPVISAARPDRVLPASLAAALVQGELSAERGDREQAVAAYLRIYQEGPPDLRRKALEALERLGEVETF